MELLKNLMTLKDRVALITGAAGHLGSVMGEALAEMGANIVLIDCNQQMCQQKGKKIEKEYGVKTLSLIVDLTDEDAIRGVSKQVEQQFGRLDILVHCAALAGTADLNGWAVPFEQQTTDSWRKAMDVNLTSVFVLTQVCCELLRRSKHGSVINISSIYGMVGPDMQLYKDTDLGNPAAYAVSKGGLIQFTKWLASNLSPEVRVNTITLGGVFRKHEEPFLSRYIERTLLKRMATEEDIKGAVAYLASDLSRYVTGHNLVVDGGWTAW